jgi:alcohol dehydrogenase (cytochrome c)
MFTALDAKTGAPLWHFPANDTFRGSPMTYMVGGKQFVTIAAGAQFLTFGLPN